MTVYRDGTRYEGECIISPLLSLPQPHLCLLSIGCFLLYLLLLDQTSVKKGLPNGRGTFTTPIGTRYEGEFLNGLRHGRGGRLRRSPSP